MTKSAAPTYYEGHNQRRRPLSKLLVNVKSQDSQFPCSSVSQANLKRKYCKRVWFILSTILCLRSLAVSTALAQTTLPGTKPLTLQGDLAAQMVDGIHSFLLRKTEQADKERERLWESQDMKEFQHSVPLKRERFKKIIGAVDPRVSLTTLELVGSTSVPAQIATGAGYKIFSVRWPVFEGTTAEGLLLQPDRQPVARIVALPDADWTPERLIGLASGIPPAAQFAQRLAENGCQVVVPVLMDRHDTWSGAR